MADDEILTVVVGVRRRSDRHACGMRQCAKKKENADNAHHDTLAGAIRADDANEVGRQRADRDAAAVGLEVYVFVINGLSVAALLIDHEEGRAMGVSCAAAATAAKTRTLFSKPATRMRAIASLQTDFSRSISMLSIIKGDSTTSMALLSRVGGVDVIAPSTALAFKNVAHWRRDEGRNDVVYDGDEH